MTEYNTGYFSRAMLKEEAKRRLKQNWGLTIVLTIAVVILSGVLNNYNFQEAVVGGPMIAFLGALGLPSEGIVSSVPLVAVGAATFGGILFAIIISIALAILINGLLKYCYTAWFVRMADRKGETLDFSDFLEGFNQALVAILAYLWQVLWICIWTVAISIPSMLLVLAIGGMAAMEFSILFVLGWLAIFIATIVALAYVMSRYAFIYQTIADSQGRVGARQAMRLSIAITRGHVWKIIVLELSFILWLLLGIITLGIGFLYVMPYMQMTFVLAYRWMRDDAFRTGRVNPADLGYVRADSAPASEQVAPNTDFTQQYGDYINE